MPSAQRRHLVSPCQGFWDSKNSLSYPRYGVTDCDIPLLGLYKHGETCCFTQVSQCIVVYPEMYRRHQTRKNLSSEAPAVVNRASLKGKGTTSNISSSRGLSREDHSTHYKASDLGRSGISICGGTSTGCLPARDSVLIHYS